MGLSDDLILDETTEEMMARAKRESMEDEMREERERLFWERYAGYLTADGQFYTRPNRKDGV